MSHLADYDDVDMGGIPSGFYADVPADAQKRLIAAIPELRLLWNAKLGEFVLVHRQPGWRAAFYGTEGVGLIHNWSIIPWPEFSEVPDKPGQNAAAKTLQIEKVIGLLRMTEAIANEKAQKYGCKDVAELADKIYDNWVENAKKQEQAELDELLGINRELGTVNPFGLASQSVKSRPYGWNGIGRADKDLPVAPKWLADHAVPALGPGKKELARREKRLREGAV